MVSNAVCEPEKCCDCRTSRDCGALVAALTHGNPCERDAHFPARYNEEPEAVFRLAFYCFGHTPDQWLTDITLPSWRVAVS